MPFIARAIRSSATPCDPSASAAVAGPRCVRGDPPTRLGPTDRHRSFTPDIPRLHTTRHPAPSHPTSRAFTPLDIPPLAVARYAHLLHTSECSPEGTAILKMKSYGIEQSKSVTNPRLQPWRRIPQTAGGGRSSAVRFTRRSRPPSVSGAAATPAHAAAAAATAAQNMHLQLPLWHALV